MLCSDFEQVIELNGIENLPEAARLHASGCRSCTSLVADFASILAAARRIPAEVEPPARVWVALRAQLEAEGIIRQPSAAVVPERVSWRHGFGQILRGRLLATAAVAGLILAVGVFVGTRRSISESPRSTNDSAINLPQPFPETATTLDQEEQSLGPMQPASTLANISPVDHSLRENLATVDAFIKECRKRLQEDPDDQMARDYLSTAYQQKAEILAAMMERGRSVN